MSTLDGNAISTLFVAATTVLGFLLTQMQGKAKTQREELKVLRRRDIASARYIYRLERGLGEHDLKLPPKPSDLAVEMADDEH